MSSTIKQAIEALKNRVADAYTAVANKGGTLPATQDSANLPAAIASIPIVGLPTDGSTFVSGFDGGSFLTPLFENKIVNLIDNTTTTLAVAYALNGLSITTAEMNALTNTTTACLSIFQNCWSITSIKFPSLNTIHWNDRRYSILGNGVEDYLSYLEFGKIEYVQLDGTRASFFGLPGFWGYLKGLKCFKIAQGWDLQDPSAYVDFAVWTAQNITNQNDIDELNDNIVNYIVNTYGGAARDIRLHSTLISKLTQNTLDAFAAKNLTIISF